MTAGHVWTPADDRQLRQLRHDNLPLRRIAAAMGIDEEHVRIRAAELALIGGPRTAADVARVPRPVSRTAAGKIDLSKAPSSMEQAFAARGVR